MAEPGFRVEVGSDGVFRRIDYLEPVGHCIQFGRVGNVDDFEEDAFRGCAHVVHGQCDCYRLLGIYGKRFLAVRAVDGHVYGERAAKECAVVVCGDCEVEFQELAVLDAFRHRGELEGGLAAADGAGSAPAERHADVVGLYGTHGEPVAGPGYRHVGIGAATQHCVARLWEVFKSGVSANPQIDAGHWFRQF